MDLIQQSLPVFQRLDELSNNGSLSREDVGIIKKKMVSGLTAFIESGAIVNEFKERSIFNPRKLLAPEPRLLAPVREYIHDSSEEPNSNEVASSEEVRRIEKLLKRMSPSEREAWLRSLNEDQK